MKHPRPELRARIIAEARSNPAPTRRKLVREFQLSLLVALSVLAALGARAGMRVIATRPWPYTAVQLLTFVGVVALVSSPLAVFARDPLGPARQQLRRRAVLAFPSLIVGTLLANLVAPETLRTPAATLGTHLACALLALSVGSAVAYLAFRLLRGSDPLAPGTTGGAIGVVAGSAAGFAASVPCPWIDPVHMLAGHVAPVAVIAVLAYALGTRLLRTTRRS